MKTPDGYRFSLQFRASSPAYIRAGETLEQLKNKKSDFIVKAVCEYLERHELEAGKAVQIHIRRELFRRDELEKMVRSMIQQYVSAGEQAHSPAVQSQRPPAVPQQTVDAAVSMMLDNLDEFL